jgi:hypothetical protein
VQTILLGLNELNFKFVEKYIQQGHLPHFKKLFEKYGYIETSSESEYQLLEPWIQWVTIHTGKTYAEHQVFRLGDIVEHPHLTQLFENIEQAGFTVGAVSPFNAANRLKNPVFFIADPWTKTASAGSTLLKKLGQAVSQIVNDNAQSRITLSSITVLLAGLIRYTPIRDYFWTFKTLLKIRTQVATKAIILDKLLSDIYFAEFKKKRPDFSLLFLNSGAHLQHHYLFNSSVYQGTLDNPEWYCPSNQDPILAIYKLYDDILGRISQLPQVRLILATGLSQQAHTELTFYWRLKKHADFLNLIEIKDFIAVHPRMSRDFLIEFADLNAATIAEEKLLACSINDTPVFTVDNRGSSLFVELIYADEIKPGIPLSASNSTITSFYDFVAFVALKNGEHNATGYYLDTVQLVKNKTIPLKQLYHLILDGIMKKTKTGSQRALG